MPRTFPNFAVAPVIPDWTPVGNGGALRLFNTLVPGSESAFPDLFAFTASGLQGSGTGICPNIFIAHNGRLTIQNFLPPSGVGHQVISTWFEPETTQAILGYDHRMRVFSRGGNALPVEGGAFKQWGIWNTGETRYMVGATAFRAAGFITAIFEFRRKTTKETVARSLVQWIIETF